MKSSRATDGLQAPIGSVERGSALLVVIMFVATITVSGLLVAQRIASISQANSQKLLATSADNVAQAISGLLSDRNVCQTGFSSSNGGVAFVDAQGNQVNFNLTQAQSPQGQTISVPGIYAVTAGLGPGGVAGSGGSGVAGAGGLSSRFVSGLLIPNTNLILNRLYVANAQLVGTAYIADLKADFASQSSNALALSTREVMKLKFQVTAGALSSCEIYQTNSNQVLCEGMNCVYTPAADSSQSGSCVCKLQAITCPVGTYITGVYNGVAQCSSTKLVRRCSAANEFLVGLDSGGREICAAVVMCPASTSRTGLGGNLITASGSVTDCRCANSNETWFNGACGVAIAGACGADNGATLSSAPTNLCTQGTASAVSGGGPWSWSCFGVSGGAVSSCSAQINSVAGICGSDNGATLSSSPTNLCSSGSASAIAGAGPWTWSCNGLSGGATVNCSASIGAGGAANKLGWCTSASGADYGYGYCYDGPSTWDQCLGGTWSPLQQGVSCTLNYTRNCPTETYTETCSDGSSSSKSDTPTWIPSCPGNGTMNFSQPAVGSLFAAGATFTPARTYGLAPFCPQAAAFCTYFAGGGLTTLTNPDGSPMQGCVAAGPACASLSASVVSCDAAGTLTCRCN